MKHYYLITGVSRGIGAALALRALATDHVVIGVSRGDNLPLREAAQTQGASLIYHQQDLSDLETLVKWGNSLFSDMTPSYIASFNLIHNAGLLDPIAQVGQKTETAPIIQSVGVNYLAPMMLTQLFVQYTQSWAIPKRVIGISSGAAYKPYSGWATYCSTKAGLDMFLKVLAAEQTAHTHPAKAVSLAPGVVDTHMQTHIRAQEAQHFPNVERFHQLKAEDRLWSPTFVASEIWQFLHHASFGQEVQVDLRNWVK